MANGVEPKTPTEEMTGGDCGVRAPTRFARCCTQLLATTLSAQAEISSDGQFMSGYCTVG